MYKATPRLTLTFCILGTIAIIILKLVYPSLLFFNSGLIIIILLTILLPEDLYTYLFSGVTILVIMVLPYLTGREFSQRLFTQQLITVSMIAIAISLVLYIKGLHRFIESEKMQLNALFEFANEGIILTDTNGEIRLINPKARNLFCYEVDEIIGKQIMLLFPESQDENSSNYLSAFYKDPTKNLAHPKHLGVKKNGESFPVEISLSHYHQQKEDCILMFITDVSERNEYENKMGIQKAELEKITIDVRKMNVELENKVAERTLILQEALKELEKSQLDLNKALNEEKELNEIKSRFVSMASHEFRTPLSTILSSASLISKYFHTEENAQREKHVYRIKDSVKVLTDLLEDFLNLGKLEEGKIMREVVLFNVREFFIDVVEELGTSLKNGQEIKLTTEGEAFFNTDKRLLKNVLINLLNNAIKFSKDGQQIDLTITNTGEKLSVQVKDNGIGIPKEDMPHLFSTFYRAKNAVNINGTGLGLHIVKRYVLMLEGNIKLTSLLNEGTTCNIGLPNLTPDSY